MIFQFLIRSSCLGLLLCAVTCWSEQRHFFANPICEQADPWITQDQGRYLACFSEGNSAISVRASDRLTVVGPGQIVWTAPWNGPASKEVWAPELHSINGRWYIYFAASDGENKNHRAWVLESAGSNPFGPYSLHGPLYTGDDPNLSVQNRWAIDLTVFEDAGRLYAIWSGWQDERDVQYLYIAPMKDPVTIAAPRTRLCANDDYLWERVDELPEGRGLNEAPEVLQHGRRTFVTYSCSGSWQPSYKIGLLELKAGSDPLQATGWTKYPKPAFESTAATFGVGHNSFVKSPDATEDWLVYHAKMSRQTGWQRAVFTQPFTWRSDGLPDFGAPVAAGQLLPVPSGQTVRCITGTRHFRFSVPGDLEGWSYFGHHQLDRLTDGKLFLGEMPRHPINLYRSGEKLVLDDGCWTNFVMTTRLSLPEDTGQAGVLFRVNTPFVGYSGQSGYFAGLNSKRTLVFGFTDGKRWHSIARASIEQPVGSECLLKVIAQGTEFEVDCNGTPLIHARDGTYQSGSIGLRVVDACAGFSDVQIAPRSVEVGAVQPLAGGR